MELRLCARPLEPLQYEHSADLSFWFMIIAHVIHVIDESLLEGSFGEKIRSIGGRNNSWENSSGSTRDTSSSWIASVVVYDLRGGSWVILPIGVGDRALLQLSPALWWAIRFREYSPGLVSSILIWMGSYFIIRYHEFFGAHRLLDCSLPLFSPFTFL
jgi:hypothetical protein